jgi:hypothetical protein
LPRGLQGLDNGGWLGLPMQDPHLLHAGHLTCARAFISNFRLEASFASEKLEQKVIFGALTLAMTEFQGQGSLGVFLQKQSSCT